MKIKLTIEYFGKNYAGWQRQKNILSVQQVLEDKLSAILQTPIKIWGSGRTDSGVHAYGQVAHLIYDGTFPIDKLSVAVNTTLPSDIRLLDAKIVDDNFHAQYDAKRKTYQYKFYISRTLHPIKNDTYAQIPYDDSFLNFNNMQKACKDLVGRHNFVGFSSVGSGIENTVRTIYSACLTKNGEDITFEICGSGFLYNMVRIIAGTLVFIGIGRLNQNAIKDVLESGIRSKAGKTYPPQGLYLKSVEYD